jgi:hypothetical protein
MLSLQRLSLTGQLRRLFPSRCRCTIVELRAAEFRDHGAKAWFCLSRRRF